jgi:hypothetical protein
MPSSAERSAVYALVQSMVVPVVAALIGAGATVAAPLVSPPASSSGSANSSGSTTGISPSGGVTIQNGGLSPRIAQCAIYEEGMVVPLARTDPGLAADLIGSRLPIDHMCGLSP